MQFKVDPEFKALIPPLTLEEKEQLTENIITDGCRDPLVVWKGLLLDGHNRFDICQEYKIKFQTKEIELIGRDEAIIWIIRNQFGRRNLIAIQRAKLALRLKPLLSVKAKEEQSKVGGDKKNLPIPQIFGEAENNSEPEKSKKKAKKNETNAKIGAMAGLSDETIRMAEIVLNEASKDVLESLDADETTISAEYKKVMQKKKKTERNETLQKKAKELPGGVFQVVYCDPPWEYKNSGFPMSAENQYPTMAIEKLKELEVKALADDNSILFMWATNPLLADALDLMSSWGFEYKTNMVWVKEKHTAGFYVFGQHELLLIGVKGSMLPTGEKPKSIITGENKVHSKKPESVYGVIEEMFPGLAYVELFARNRRTGWESWGNQA